ncbi:MAG: AAA family ATPase [Ardenticatenaceae bacterium]
MIVTISGYDINELLYESSNSLVYRAQRQSDKQAVIVKMLSEAYPSPEKIAWFKREYEVTRDFNLAGVPEVYSYESEQNRWLIVLEDFGGESLKRLRLAGSLELADFLTLAIKVTDILGQIHAKQIMHKDINPANIVFNPTTRQVKLIDFGISTVLERENPTAAAKNPNVLEGTLSYISPEQTGRMNRPVDYRTDFYSLGVTFYELLTGQLPFESDEPLELVHHHIAKQPVAPHDLVPDIPVPISSIVLKLMAKNAQERYQSASGLRADLETCLGHTGSIMPFALGQQDISDRFQIPAKLYGRAQEIKSLTGAFQRVSTGATEMMLVAGYAGIGKSALVQEVYKPITLVRGYYLAGKFDQFQRDIPYAAFIQAFRSLMRQLLTESEADIARWREKLQAALGPLGQVISRVIPEVELIIGPQPDVPELAPTQAQNRFNLVFQNFINVFAQVEHPLVIFLDDLQWADRASLSLINILMTAPDSHHLFLIGAYRDNEVGSAHPLMLTLDDISKNGTTVNQITLSELALPDVRELIAETLHCTKERAQPLSELVHSKTGGNPFFLREFLKSLYSQKLLTFDYQRAAWQWDVAQIQAEEITDNVVELMAGKVKQLPHQTQAVLKLAACIGNQFDLQTLALVYQNMSRGTRQSPAQTAADLWPAMRSGLLLPLSDAYKVVSLSGADQESLGASLSLGVEYKFVHDRVQQAVYSLIPAAEKQATHLEVGRQLLDHLPIDMREERIFDLVNQLNQGRDLIESEVERLQLAELNLQAGRKAKASVAIQPAFNYLQVGVALLGKDPWHRQYELTLAMYVEAAQAAYLCGDFEQMERLTDSVQQKAKSLLDKVKAVEVRIEGYFAQNKLLQVIQSTRQILSLLGFTFPQNPSQLDVAQAFSETEAALAGKPLEKLALIPEMTIPEKVASISLMEKAVDSIFIHCYNLYLLITLEMINLSLQYGITSGSCVAFANYGSMLRMVVGDIERGYQYDQLALSLTERLNFQHLKATVMFGFNVYAAHWKKHLRETLPALREGYQISLETGNVITAAYTLVGHTFAHSYYAGKELIELERQMVKHRQVISQLKQKHALYTTDQYWQSALSLLGRTENPSLLRGQAYDAEKMLPIHHQANNKSSIFGLHFQSLFLSYLFEEYQQAANHATLAAEYLNNSIGSLRYSLFHFYASLAQLAVYALRAAPEAEQKALLEKVAANQEKMEQWAQHAPMNQLHKFYLVEAERARVLGEDGQAREYYDQAIDLARENEYLNEEALAYELAGKFYLAKGRTQVAQLYLRNAHYAYQRWGALAKVEQLEEKHSFLLQATRTERRATSTTITTGTRATTSLDIESVLKANQAIAGEIQLAALLEKMIKIVIENAGAERGLLMLEKGGQWVIEAEGTVDSTQMTVLQGLSPGMSRGTRETRQQLVSSDLLPLSIVNYVVRTQKNVVLDEATQEGQFTADPYIVAKRPQSILCMPLVNQGRLTAILYLENNLTTGAFTPERLEVLNMLSSQAAISLENATLYNTLEQKVEERTIELQHEIVERKRAEEAANEANQAKSTFLANMSHELRTPLNAILGFSQIMRRSRSLPSDHVDNLGIISRSGEHLLTLINNVLDLSKIEAGKTTLNEKNFDLYRLLDDLEEMFQLKADDKRLQLIFERTPDLPRYVHTDEVKLRQILINLLNNALKFTDFGGVSVHVAPNRALNGATALSFSVSDTGAGIAAEELDKLFEAFVQTQSGKKAQEGTGLGLPISRQFVKLMGGEIRVESQVGRGTTFHFDIQVTLVDASDLKEAQPTRRVIALEPNQPRYRVLIVDDKWSNRQLLIKLLNPLGFALKEATHGQEAIEIWDEWSPHLIWMDMRMAVMDGYEATKRIKQTTKGQATAIIALTASTLEEERAVVLKAGCDDFLRKPFRENDIFDIMHKHIGVRYIYDEDQASSERTTVAEQEALTPAALAALPEALLASLFEAVEGSDLELMEEVLAQIGEQNPALATQLTTLADEFEYDEMLELIEEAYGL